MEYKKPVIGSDKYFDGLIPAIAPIVGLSAKALTVVGAAAGLLVGMQKSGGNIIDSSHITALTERKNFVLE